MNIDYARVSISDHDMTIQLAALRQAGCEQIFTDDFDGVWKNLPGLETALNHMQEGDVLVVWRLERLARSLKQLVDTVNHLQERGLRFQSLQESIDTTTSEGDRLIFQACTILARAERDMIQERTKIGLRAARARGRKGGRPKKLDADTTEMAYELYDRREHSVSEICGLVAFPRVLFTLLSRKLVSERET